MSLKVLSKDEVFTGKPEWREPGRENYLAMYSSVFGGVVTDPNLMVMPLDDHIINRGDGLFEFFDVVEMLGWLDFDFFVSLFPYDIMKVL